MSTRGEADIGGFRETSEFSIRIPGDETTVNALHKIANATIAPYP
jgi:hypothetical protein